MFIQKKLNHFPKKCSFKNPSRFSLSPNEAPTSRQISDVSLNTKPRSHKFDATEIPSMI